MSDDMSVDTEIRTILVGEIRHSITGGIGTHPYSFILLGGKTDKFYSTDIPTKMGEAMISFANELRKQGLINVFTEPSYGWYRGDAKESFSEAIKNIKKIFPNTNTQLFTTKYMEIFNITEPTADMVTELI
jgi:hypothetical protein